MKGKYDDIINLPHHVSKDRPHMSIGDRAAQFGAFAALTGYDGQIKETARLTEEDVALTEYQYRILNEKMAYIVAHRENTPLLVCVTLCRTKERTAAATRSTGEGYGKSKSTKKK